MQAHLEIHLQGQWRECATLDVSAPAKGGAAAAVFAYDTHYVLNLAMGNADNHARNSAVQIVENRVQLTPLFDFAPMYLDKEGIARALRWQDEKQKELRNWADVLAQREQLRELARPQSAPSPSARQRPPTESNHG